ncbi:hypothetical protein [Stenotrophomonas indicatrix]|uniref:hypothetical protein n=1 Tax=Stenotrophomonas indicatrix TaxID=2045451 RepID=UPI0028AE3C56|nr:hypothetical protein [Stenotrophomonas indicatrix]
MTPHGFGTFWLLYVQFWATMTIEQLRATYFPTAKLKTMANKHTAGPLPPRVGDKHDTRDVASWWDDQRKGRAA